MCENGATEFIKEEELLKNEARCAVEYRVLMTGNEKQTTANDGDSEFELRMRHLFGICLKYGSKDS